MARQRAEYFRQWREKNRARANELSRESKQRLRERIGSQSTRSACGARACKICNIEQDADQFYGGARQCKSCIRRMNYERYHERYAQSDEFRAARKKRSKLKYDATRSHQVALRKARYRRRRDLVLAHYGTSCACCGESQREFLAIDHINNDGAQHRRLIRSKNLTNWLVQHKFPTGFQTLCHNCNSAKAIYGTCPHQKAKLRCAS